jgi:hypothetical protein
VKEKGHFYGKIRLTKLDCARRQIETAILLFFEDIDPVSYHTLTAAAYEILRGLNFKVKGEPMMRDSELVHPESRKEWKKIHSEAENFFKHATEDPTDTFRLDPRLTGIMLAECVWKYWELSKEPHQLMKMFLLFMGLHVPELFQKQFIESFRQFLPVDYRPGDVTKKQFAQTLIRNGMLKRFGHVMSSVHNENPSGESTI